MKSIRKSHRKLTNGIYYAVMILLTIFFLFPFFYMFSKSFMSVTDTLATPPKFFPTKIYFKNYGNVFDVQMIKWTFNTLYIIVFNMVFGSLSASFCAFGFAKLEFKGKNISFAIMLSTVMLPGIVMQIPLFVIYNILGWMNTSLPLTLPAVFGGGAMTIFLYMQFMKGIPKEMDEAAIIDGANPFMRYFKICLPLCRSIIIFQCVGIFMGQWNDYMGPLIYINDPEKYTLGLGIYYKYIRESLPGVDVAMGSKMASGVVFSIPPLIFFFIFQKQLIAGINLGGVKG